MLPVFTAESSPRRSGIPEVQSEQRLEVDCIWTFVKQPKIVVNVNFVFVAQLRLLSTSLLIVRMLDNFDKITTCIES